MPLSTAARPKAFLSVTADRKTMFRRTVERISRLIPEKNIIVVANKAHAGLVKRDFRGMRKDNLLLEPAPKNTAPAIALAALALAQRCGNATMVVVPSDHYITRETAYLKALRGAVDLVGKNRSAIVTLGIRPAFPATAYGYIKVKSKKSKVKSICRVESFTEKPDLKTAEKFLKSGQYLWNSGIFVFNAGDMLRNLEDFAPAIWRAFRSAGIGHAGRVYNSLPDISIDYAVMEKAGCIYCVKGSFGWKDIGSFGALKEILLLERRRFIEKDGKVTRIL
jgi:mannose-1-phosphate guanylyltransferase